MQGPETHPHTHTTAGIIVDTLILKGTEKCKEVEEMSVKKKKTTHNSTLHLTSAYPMLSLYGW